MFLMDDIRIWKQQTSTVLLSCWILYYFYIPYKIDKSILRKQQTFPMLPVKEKPKYIIETNSRSFVQLFTTTRLTKNFY